MEKLLEFGRKAWFIVRVLSGYEERRIRSHRLLLQKRLQLARERKAALRKIPEQAILAEVRQMVEAMQSLNQRLEETEAAIEDYFKPIDKEAQIIMNIQLESEEKTMRAMMKAMQEQALQEKAAAEKLAKDSTSNASHQSQGATTASIPATASAPAATNPN